MQGCRTQIPRGTNVSSGLNKFSRTKKGVRFGGGKWGRRLPALDALLLYCGRGSSDTCAASAAFVRSDGNIGRCCVPSARN